MDLANDRSPQESLRSSVVEHTTDVLIHTTVYASDVSPMVLQFVINNDLNLLSTWFNQNRLHVNNDKTQAIPVSKCKYDYSLVLNGTYVESLNIIKILGVTLDSMLTFKEHITIQLKKLKLVQRHPPLDVLGGLYP